VSLNARQTGPADFVVVDGTEQIAEIRDLRLVFARFRPGGRALIGATYPLPLYWIQYANHQDPERNAGTDASVRLISQNSNEVVLECLGKTASGSCLSRILLTIRSSDDPVRFTYTIDAKLDVLASQGWLVTPNPTQGEVEFANIWPDGTFSPRKSDRKLYHASYVVTPRGVERIPHHHLESADKHRIEMNGGDRFVWLKEDENPCLELVSERRVTAGVCAYMWDSHFAYKICADDKEVVVPAGTRFAAAFKLTSLDDWEAEEIIRRATDRPSPSNDTIPLYVNGVNRFSETILTIAEDRRFVWPWEQDIGENATLIRDQSCGFDDTTSLRISSHGPGTSCWKATTIGPAFGGDPFVGSSRYRLSARVKTDSLSGQSLIAIRLHREAHGNVFDLRNYEVFESPVVLRGDTDWTPLEVVTPPIDPAPDRLHLLLIQREGGTTWFDNVLLETIL
jgi:hypothetical protein